MTLGELYKIIQERKKIRSSNSYAASLFKAGRGRIAQKVGEEAIETIIASLSQNKKRVIEETADLWFHTLVLLATDNIHPSAVMKELQKRHEKKKEM